MEEDSLEAWLQKCELGDFESQRDAYLCLARHPQELHVHRKCSGCKKSISGKHMRCLECKDVGLCYKCCKQGDARKDHKVTHEMVNLRYSQCCNISPPYPLPPKI